MAPLSQSAPALDARKRDSLAPPALSKPATVETPVDTSVPPPSLPRASREKMRACADEWKKMKLEKSGLPMWRDFATSCLTRD